MKLVLDTNVIVSGFLNPFGPPGMLVRLAAEGIVTLCYDARILAEYREVLLRPAFRLEEEAVEDFLRQVREDGYAVTAQPLSKRLPDPDDDAFLEVALAGQAEALVTGNSRHFPRSHRQEMQVLDPRETLELLRKR